ncbi:MAG TPA: LPS export ABC transporter periplasmic protein LptC [Fimbriimonadaceae bacterium]|nr:LPS export ABC transporter periplasmic protein LptC [Fimbriimonadaceae bacterium]
MLLCLAGCSGSAKQETKPKPAPKEKPLLDQPLTVNVPHGEATIRGELPRRDLIYHITWGEGVIQVGNEGIFAGTMDAVSGEFYEKGTPASTFRADHAKADRATDTLTLTGHVTVVSKTQDATLTCDKVEWRNKEQIVKAFGHIEIRGGNGIISGLDELWATPKLDYISTPGMYKKP